MNKYDTTCEEAVAARVARAEERKDYANFAKRYGADNYRERLCTLYDVWQRDNEAWFAGALEMPHLGIARTASRALGECARQTGYGGELLITLNARLVFGDNRKLVVRPWPAEGCARFLADLLLRLTVRQYVVEVHDNEEEGHQGFGPLFVEEANRIGTEMHLGKVVTRRRKKGSAAVASGWPHCVRPDGYYQGDVTRAALRLAGVGRQQRRGPAETATQGAFELIDYLLTAGRVDDLRTLVQRRLKAAQEVGTLPARRKRGEAGAADGDTEAPADVEFRQEWLVWNGGTVQRLARSIRQSAGFADVPLLADALVEAGCSDERILAHLRQPRKHGKNCWVLRHASGDS